MVFGERVERRDARRGQKKGKPSQYDLEVIVHGRRLAIEVTQITDPSARKDTAALMSRLNSITERVSLSWRIEIQEVPDPVRPLIDGLAKFLPVLEAQGISDIKPLVGDRWQDVDSDLNARIISLGVERCSVVGPSPGIMFALSQALTSETDALIRAIEREANKDDNRNKLRIAEVDERHLFIWLGRGSTAEYVEALNSVDLAVPSLPDEVDVIWLGKFLGEGAVNAKLIALWKFTKGAEAWEVVKNPFERDVRG